MEFKDEFTLNVNSSRETEFKDLSRIPSEGIQLQYLAPTVYEARDWIAQKCNTILLPDATWEYVDPDDMTNTEEVIRYSFMIFGEMHSEESYETMEEALKTGIFGQQGWICPKCGRVYSPFTSMCSFCSNDNIFKITCMTK